MSLAAPDSPDFNGQSESFFNNYVNRFTGNSKFDLSVSLCQKGSFDSADISNVTSTSSSNIIDLPLDISPSADVSLYDGAYSYLLSNINADNSGGKDLLGLVKAAQ